MAHKEQTFFVAKVKNEFPSYFSNRRVLEIGSYNINGSVRSFFDDCSYTGIDVCPGPDVDIVCPGQEYHDNNGYDTIISCEMLEHNIMWRETLVNIIHLLNRNGLFIMTCATTGRGIHGTIHNSPKNSPSSSKYGDYYRNITEQDIRNVLDVDGIFIRYCFEINRVTHDLYMWGIKVS